MFAQGETLRAPAADRYWDPLRFYVAVWRKESSTRKRGREAIQDVATLALRRYGHESLLLQRLGNEERRNLDRL